MQDQTGRKKSRKVAGLIICLLAYITAGFMAWLVYDAVSIFHPVVIVLILNVLVTLTIFIFSVMFNNSSLYDPYWSIVPPLILLFWVFHEQTPEALTFLQVTILSLVFLWSVRLTLNWLLRWRGFRDEDWRYIAYRFKYREEYWVVSLLVIHLFPTLIIFLGCLAVYPALVLHEGTMGLMEWIAALITFAAIAIEMISDWQLKNFVREESKSDFLNTGLWKYSRHPNYFGEVLFWMGLFLFSTGMEKVYWWILPGPVFMILMFYWVSIPMIDKRMLRRRTGYRDYLKRTSGLIPMPQRKSSDSSFTILK